MAPSHLTTFGMSLWVQGALVEIGDVPSPIPLPDGGLPFNGLDLHEGERTALR